MDLIYQKKAIQYFETAIKGIKSDIDNLELSFESLEKRLFVLEKIIDPDKEDVYNINRRIEILAQRIAKLESKPKKEWWPFRPGGLVE
jgi:ubiquinone biosynthesis protein UbiJ